MTGLVLTEMSMVIVDGDILSVQGWWLPRGGITKLEQLRMSSGKAVEWRIWCVCLFVCLLYYYWLLEDIYGVGVFADGRSDVLGSGGRGFGRGESACTEGRWTAQVRAEKWLKEARLRQVSDWRRWMSLCG